MKSSLKVKSKLSSKGPTAARSISLRTTCRRKPHQRAESRTNMSRATRSSRVASQPPPPIAASTAVESSIAAKSLVAAKAPTGEGPTTECPTVKGRMHQPLECLSRVALPSRPEGHTATLGAILMPLPNHRALPVGQAGETPVTPPTARSPVPSPTVTATPPSLCSQRRIICRRMSATAECV